MILSKNLFQQNFKAPQNIGNIPTSKLLENGVFCYYLEPGYPTYLPFGRAVLNNIQQILTEESERFNIPVVEIPLVMDNDVLNKGEPLGQIFRDKVFYLEGQLKGKHMLTTPEPFMIELASKAIQTHAQLPIIYTYHVDVFRALHHPEGILKGRQFKTFMGNSFDANKDSRLESLSRFESMTESAFSRFKIKTHKLKGSKGIDAEYFYTCPEGDNLDLPEISDKRVSALSLAMVYHYCPNTKLWARFRTSDNKNARVLYNTYGLGTQRVFYSALDSCRDELGFNLPENLQSYKVAVVPLSISDKGSAERLYNSLRKFGASPVLDDRDKIQAGEKCAFADFVGIPYKAVVSQEGVRIKRRDGPTLAESVSVERAYSLLEESRSVA